MVGVRVVYGARPLVLTHAAVAVEAGDHAGRGERRRGVAAAVHVRRVEDQRAALDVLVRVELSAGRRAERHSVARVADGGHGVARLRLRDELAHHVGVAGIVAAGKDGSAGVERLPATRRFRHGAHDCPGGVREQLCGGRSRVNSAAVLLDKRRQALYEAPGGAGLRVGLAGFGCGDVRELLQGEDVDARGADHVQRGVVVVRQDVQHGVHGELVGVGLGGSVAKELVEAVGVAGVRREEVALRHGARAADDVLLLDDGDARAVLHGCDGRGEGRDAAADDEHVHVGCLIDGLDSHRLLERFRIAAGLLDAVAHGREKRHARDGGAADDVHGQGLRVQDALREQVEGGFADEGRLSLARDHDGVDGGGAEGDLDLDVADHAVGRGDVCAGREGGLRLAGQGARD